MVCRNCGKQVPLSAGVCSECGYNVSSFLEKILRLINIIVMAVSLICAFVGILAGNIWGGIILASITILSIVFVFRNCQIAKIKKIFGGAFLQRLVAVVIYCILPVIIFIGFGVWGTLDNSVVSPKGAAESYVTRELKEDLKNPDSLKVHSSKVISEFEYGEYFYYNISIDYSAQNGFGGYNRDTYERLVKVRKSDSYATSVSIQEYKEALEGYMIGKGDKT